MGLKREWAVAGRAVGMGLLLVCGMGCGRVQSPQGPAPLTQDEQTPLPDAPGSAPDEASPPAPGADPHERRPPSLRTQNHASFISVAMNARGAPTLAWKEAGGGTATIPVREWDGSDWTALGQGPATQKSVISTPVMALDAMGRPVVAWTDGTRGMSRGVFASRWDGHAWTALEGSASARSGQFNAHSPSVVVDAEDKPVVAWVAYAGDASHVFVERWSGKDWRLLGAPLSGFEGPPGERDYSHAASTALVIDSTGQPVIAWYEWDTNDRFSSVFVRRWTGETWQPLGGPLNALGRVALDPSIASSPDGTLYVAWTEADERFISRIYIRKWDGSQWTEIADPSPLGGNRTAIEARIVTDPEGRLFVSWKGMDDSPISHVHAGRWTDSGWQLLPVPEEAAGAVDQPALASAGGRVFLGWLRNLGEGSVYSAFGQELKTPP